MNIIIFASPAATGKTHFAEALRDYFKCDRVLDDGRTPVRQTGESDQHTLILCCPGEDVGPGHVLDRDQMNRAMVAVGGIPIWNDDGSVNLCGKRTGVQA